MTGEEGGAGRQKTPLKMRTRLGIEISDTLSFNIALSSHLAFKSEDFLMLMLLIYAFSTGVGLKQTNA